MKQLGAETCMNILLFGCWNCLVRRSSLRHQMHQQFDILLMPYEAVPMLRGAVPTQLNQFAMGKIGAQPV